MFEEGRQIVSKTTAKRRRTPAPQETILFAKAQLMRANPYALLPACLIACVREVHMDTFDGFE